MKILLIENDADDAEIISDILNREDKWRATRAESLSDGRAKIDGLKPDLVLLDLGLPDSMPEQTLQAIPSLAEKNALIVLTGYGDAFVKAIAIGADAYILKDAMRDPKDFVKQIHVAMDAYLHRTTLKPRPIQSLDPRETLIAMSKTARVPVSEIAVKSASPAQAEGMIITMQGIAAIQASLGRIDTTLAAQNIVLGEHGAQLKTGALVMNQIDQTTKATNGRVNVIEPLLNSTVIDVAVIMSERKGRILKEETLRLQRDGLMVLPRKVGTVLKWCWKNILIVLQWLGAIGLAWPFLQWLWDHHSLGK